MRISCEQYLARASVANSRSGFTFALFEVCLGELNKLFTLKFEPINLRIINENLLVSQCLIRITIGMYLHTLG